MKTKQSRSLVYVLDDDQIFQKLLLTAFKRFSIKCETFGSSAALLNRLDENQPALCLVDLNVEAKESSLNLLQTIRAHFKEVPVIVVSTTSDKHAVAHAIEMGANDFLLKPLDRNVLVSKLLGYLDSSELEAASKNFPAPLEMELKVSLGIDVDLQEVDELGIRVTSKAMIVKGSVLPVSGEIIQEITGRDKPLLVTVATTWVEPDQHLYSAYLEFDISDKELLHNARRWLALRQKTA